MTHKHWLFYVKGIWREISIFWLKWIIIWLGRHMYTVHDRGADLPFFLRFGNGPILEQINLLHSQTQPYVICTRVIYLTQTYFYVEHHTEKQLVLFVNSFVWLGLWWIRTLDLLNSKQTLYYYPIELNEEGFWWMKPLL